MSTKRSRPRPAAAGRKRTPASKTAGKRPAARLSLASAAVEAASPAAPAPVVFDAANRELRNVCAFFQASPRAVSKIAWRADVRDLAVEPGRSLGQVLWDDGSVTEIAAPAGCAGSVRALGKYDPDLFHLAPSQVLLYLA